MRNQSWKFFQAFLKSPRVVASMVPSSPFLERRIVEAARLDRASTVVELGCGTGGTTRAMLAALGPEARLIAIERTGEFAEAVSRMDDRRLDVVHGCASTIADVLAQRGLASADAVVSGIPFSTLPPDLAGTIMRGIHAALAADGRFVAYQFTDKVAHYARPVLGPPRIEHELRNVPPLKVFTWQKSADSAAA